MALVNWVRRGRRLDRLLVWEDERARPGVPETMPATEGWIVAYQRGQLGIGQVCGGCTPLAVVGSVSGMGALKMSKSRSSPPSLFFASLMSAW